MKNLKLVFALFLLTGIVSCKKLSYEKTSIKATLFDESTQLGIPNSKTILYEVKKENSLNGNPTYNKQVLKEAYTDANGQVDFGEFEAHRSNKYDYVITYGIDMYGNPFNTRENSIKKGIDNYILLPVWGTIDLTIKFLPPPPYNTGDSLAVSINYINRPKPAHRVTNNSYSQSSVLMNLSSGNYYINIDKYKSGIYTNTKDTVFYPAYSTNEYDVTW